MSFNTRLINLLKEDYRFTDQNGELIVAAVTDRAWRLDSYLVKTLLRDEEIKATFFKEIEGHWIFHATKFIDYVCEKNFLDSSYTRFRNKIGLNIGRKFLRERGEVTLAWPYKDCVLEGGQTREDQKRKEIFFNETLARDEIGRMFAPKALTGWRRYSDSIQGGYTRPSEIRRSKDGAIQENILVKGNNLIALHSLSEQFRGKVKLIYIDPMYNTGSDSFGYNDRFNRSTWLTFMQNRLEVARRLLRDDGVIFIHIDDHEMHYLKVIADDVFGKDNFIATVPRKTRTGKADVPYKLSQDFDWMLIYTNKASRKDVLFRRAVSRKYYKSPDYPDDEWRLSPLTTQRTIKERPNSNFTMVNPKNGQEFLVNPNRCWAVTKDTFHDYYGSGKIVFPGDYDFIDIKVPYLRIFKSEEIKWRGEDYDKTYVSASFANQVMDELLKDMLNKKGTEEIIELFGEKKFPYAKNELLLQRIIEYATQDGDIVMDYHVGSGTTAAVAHKMGRQWIAIEQMDYIEECTVERLKKVLASEQGGVSESVGWEGGGDFLFCELAPYNQSFMDRILSASSSDELSDIWTDMSKNSFLKWYVNPEDPDNALEDLKAVGEQPDGLNKQKRLLAELLDKSQLYVHYSEIDDPDFNISEEDKELTRQFYEGGSDDS